MSDVHHTHTHTHTHTHARTHARTQIVMLEEDLEKMKLNEP